MQTRALITLLLIVFMLSVIAFSGLGLTGHAEDAVTRTAITTESPAVLPQEDVCTNNQDIELQFGTDDIAYPVSVEKPQDGECGGGIGDFFSPDKVLVYNTPGGAKTDPNTIRLWSTSALVRHSIIKDYDKRLSAKVLCTGTTRVCVGFAGRILTLGLYKDIYLWRKKPIQPRDPEPRPTPGQPPRPTIPLPPPARPTPTPIPAPSFVRPSIAVIKKNNTGTGTTELHVLSGPNGFQQFALNTGTAQHVTGGEYTFRMADWDRDGRPDLIGIKENATGTGSTEVHILSGASNYQQFILHTGTPQPETGDDHDHIVADWNRDGYPDLIIIKKYNTGTGSTEVHILSGASNFQQFILHTGTPQEETGINYDFATGDWDRDGYPDLFIIKKYGTGTGMTEVHILSGSSSFQRFILHTGTAQHPTGDEYTFRVGDWNGDGVPDLIGIKKYGTETGSTEIHILSGASNFQQFLLHTGTVQEQTGSNYDFDVVRW